MTEVIVYRNPLEAAFWNAIMSGQFFPILLGMIAFMVTFLCLHRLVEMVFGTWGKWAGLRTGLSMIVAIIIAITTAWWFWI